MRLHYITPSLIPSRSANSIHVTWMCDSLSKLNFDIELYFKRTRKNNENLLELIKKHYGVGFNNINLNSYHLQTRRFEQIFIFILFVIRNLKFRKQDIYFSRNIYAAFYISCILRKKVAYEIHELEKGIRKILQKKILKSKYAFKILISNEMLKAIRKQVGSIEGRYLILHDAAKEINKDIHKEKKVQIRDNIGKMIKHNIIFAVGYFGHLYEGRGIQLIIELAKTLPEIDFLVFGGNEKDILKKKGLDDLANLYFGGFIQPSQVHEYMSSMDILLMPYQNKVSIGVKNKDTSMWMSPMKMFEYMSCEVPIISSDLKVLREILQHNRNCLLSKNDDVNDWRKCIMSLKNDKNLAKKISKNAYFDYKEKYTWDKRANFFINSYLKFK